MTEPLPDPAATAATPEAPAAPRTAGAMLRAAREREGLHLAVLAATIKVAPAKLDALEKDRYDELPNPTFARALAQSVCRSLKIDPRPVLALLPQQDAPPLENAVGRLNTPFQERPSRGDGSGLAWASKPMFLAGGLLLVAAVVVGLLPREWIDGRGSGAGAMAPAPLASAVASVLPAAASAVAAVADAVSAPSTTVTEVVTAVSVPASAAPATPAAASAAPAPAPASAPPSPAAAASPAVTAPPRTGALQLSASAESWIEVVDADGRSLLSRVVLPGEAVALDGRAPLRLRIGNAAGTVVNFRGAVVDLAPYTRDNVARLELR